MKKIKADNLQLVISSILDAYSDDVKEVITESAKKVGEEGKDKLKKSSPKRTGSYRKGWRLVLELNRLYI